MKMKLTFSFLVFIFSFTIHSQTGSFIGADLSGWASRYYSDIHYSFRKPSHVGSSIHLGFGQLGKRLYDKKTKDIFGRIYSNTEKGKNYYETNNIGGIIKIDLDYQFDFNRIIKLNTGICGIIAIYQQRSSFDEDTIVGNMLTQKRINEKYIRGNLAFGFDVKMMIRLSKKCQLSAGITIPFFFFNPNDFNISKEFDPVLLGVEPVLDIGFIFQISGHPNR